MSSNLNQITKKAGLIVTFYGEHKHLETFMNELGARLDLTLRAMPHRPDLSDPDRHKYLRYFDPPTAPDTRVVQLALGEQSGDARVAWDTLREKLEKQNFNEIFDIFAREEEAKEPRAIFLGYTLIYHATLSNGVSLDEATQDDLFRLAHRPDSSPWDRPEPLAHNKVVEEGDLWLMDIPNKGNGVEAATVYVALSSQDKENDLITKILYGASAALLMPDLIAHKGYHQIREYFTDPGNPDETSVKLYKQTVDKLRDIIGPFLGFDIQGSQTGNKPQDLTELEFVYGQLLYATSYLDEPRLSLAQQLKNYEWWQDKLGKGDLAAFHYNYMEVAKEELDLLIDKGRGMLEGARTTIEMVQTEQNQAREERENRIGGCLTILGVALAVSQIVNETAAKALLNLFNDLPWVSLCANSRLLQLGVQFLITWLVTIMIYWLYQKWRRNTPLR